MTDTTNGWPGKPGMPRDPEQDGWHWLRTPDGELVPYNWRPEGECERGRWASAWIYDREDDWPPVECTYLGPCLTPDEATALQARCKEAERERAHQHGLADRNAAEYAREQAKREALQARVAELEEALGTLEKGASYTAKLGAVTGAHWLGLGTALINARAALEGKKA